MIRVTDLKENLITDNSRLRLNGKIITCAIKPYPNEDSSAVLSHAGVLFFYCVVLTSESVDKIL